jgi:hypothetical protein
MKATVVDIRYRMNDVLKALDRNEDVSILYHGHLKGIIRATRREATRRVTEHPFFNMQTGAKSVEAEMKSLRGERYP